MKLDCVLTATNDNPLYLDFVPVFVKAWRALFPEIDIKIVLVAESIPDILKEYSSNIILFPPIVGVSTAFTAQYIRSLYPGLLGCTGGVLITDMDMVPMNRDYYVGHIGNITNEKFVVYRPVCLVEKELCMCYNIAVPRIWSDIFGIKNVQDIRDHLVKEYSKVDYDGIHGGKGWQTDQKCLYEYVVKWDKQYKGCVFMSDKTTGYRRFDRLYNFNLPIGIYTDYHLHRPYSNHKQFVDTVVGGLKPSESELDAHIKLLEEERKDVDRINQEIKMFEELREPPVYEYYHIDTGSPWNQ